MLRALSVLLLLVVSLPALAAEEAPGAAAEAVVAVSVDCQSNSPIRSRVGKLVRRGSQITRKLAQRASGAAQRARKLLKLAAPPYPKVRGKLQARMSGNRAARLSRRGVTVTVN